MKLRKYKHYKGKDYQVTGIAYHSETLEKLVIYKALYNSKKFGRNAIWVRPMDNFLEKIEKTAYSPVGAKKFLALNLLTTKFPKKSKICYYIFVKISSHSI